MFLFPGIARVQEHAAMVKSVSGSVDIQRLSTKINAQKGMILTKEDVLLSGDKGFAGIIFTDGTVLTIGPETEFRIDSSVFAPESVKISTPKAAQKGYGYPPLGLWQSSPWALPPAHFLPPPF